MKLNDITVGQSVIVLDNVLYNGSFEFSAIVSRVAPDGTVRVRDQDDDCFDVLPIDLALDDGDDY